ncbi:hypothetical protein BIV24_26925 [Streptomyces colonosanans]|uniref:Uncharacterized protein n=1 Tax=Streptomyces colonosanans TaxID=1428652 RepID=A0A1S2NY20_9ACTN|nr:hypothetical protein BIV24_26925 [Streptomyces colonosanans]
MVIGAAVLLFIASFLDLSGCGASSDICSRLNLPNSWDNLGLGLGTYMAGVLGGALVVICRLQPAPRKVVGLDLGVVGTTLTVSSAWVLLWTLIDFSDAGSGLILGFIAALALAAAAIATPLVPTLQAALVSAAPKPPAPQPYGAQPQGGYGYPGAQQPFGGQPQQGQQPGEQPQQSQQFGGQPQQQGQSFGGQPQQEPQFGGQPQQAPAGDFSPFWFAVPVPRPLFAEDGSPTPIAELAPGTWYLAVEQRGTSLVAQTQDGRRGVLQDTSGIQRG